MPAGVTTWDHVGEIAVVGRPNSNTNAHVFTAHRSPAHRSTRTRSSRRARRPAARIAGRRATRASTVGGRTRRARRRGRRGRRPARGTPRRHRRTGRHRDCWIRPGSSAVRVATGTAGCRRRGRSPSVGHARPSASARARPRSSGDEVRSWSTVARSTSTPRPAHGPAEFTVRRPAARRNRPSPHAGSSTDRSDAGRTSRDELRRQHAGDDESTSSGGVYQAPSCLRVDAHPHPCAHPPDYDPPIRRTCEQMSCRPDHSFTR